MAGSRNPVLMRNRIVLTAASVVMLAGIACSDGSTNRNAPPAPTEPSLAKGGAPKPVKAVNVSPSSAALTVGQTVQLTATAAPKNAAATFAWSSANTAVATVSASGLVTAVGAGTTTVTASAGGKSGSATVTVAGSPPPGGAVLVGAGDIAVCSTPNDEATAALLDGIAGTVFTLGDNVYSSGTVSEFANCYDPSWGRHRTRTRPSVGNHEYGTANAAGYYGYFGAAAGDPAKGYYSYDLGDWHIIVLNTNLSCSVISCAAGSVQEQWLRADLAANSKACTLAYWHHPRFNSGASHGNNVAVAPFWNALYEFNADVVLNGHEHVYERFGPQTPGAVADAARGIRQFTVGTGGRTLYTFKATPEPNSQVRNASAYGVLKLTLHATSYDWQFVPIAGSTFTDTGSGSCH